MCFSTLKSLKFQFNEYKRDFKTHPLKKEKSQILKFLSKDFRVAMSSAVSSKSPMV